MKGGTPDMDAAVTRKQAKVMGIRLASPPSLARSVVPVCRSTEPAVRKRPDLYIAWLIMWKMPPIMPAGTAVPMPRIM